jgi:hypothetical protein
VLIWLKVNLLVKMNSESPFYGGSDDAAVRASSPVCCLGFMGCAFVSNFQSVCLVILVAGMFACQYVCFIWTWVSVCDSEWVLLCVAVSVGYCATHNDIMMFYYKCY